MARPSGFWGGHCVVTLRARNFHETHPRDHDGRALIGLLFTPARLPCGAFSGAGVVLDRDMLGVFLGDVESTG